MCLYNPTTPIKTGRVRSLSQIAPSPSDADAPSSTLPLHLQESAQQAKCEKIENVYSGVHDGRLLGTGVSGHARLVTHRQTGEQFAVKIIPFRNHKADQLMSEVELLARMDHKNIVKLYETYQDDQHLYLVQEYVSGGDLFDYLQSQPHGRLPEKRAMELAKQMLEAIEYLHRNHVLHRDLKLENFLLTRAGDLKLIDFGVAKEFNHFGQGHKEGVGTPYSVAPQVIMRKYTERCDIWSIGVLTYALLSGKCPFGGCDGGDLLLVRESILKGKVSFRGWPRGISSNAKQFCKSLLQVDAQKRPSARVALEHAWLNPKQKLDVQHRHHHRTHKALSKVAPLRCLVSSV